MHGKNGKNGHLSYHKSYLSLTTKRYGVVPRAFVIFRKSELEKQLLLVVFQIPKGMLLDGSRHPDDA